MRPAINYKTNKKRHQAHDKTKKKKPMTVPKLKIKTNRNKRII